MKTRLCLAVCVALAVLPPAARAERPLQRRESAIAVIVGKVQKIAEANAPFGADGTITHYTADLVVRSVEKGKDLKDGQLIQVHWSHVTKRPSAPLPGAYGHDYSLKPNDYARFWLVRHRSAARKVTWQIIYNRDGVEKLRK
jgi:hypothetical protein